MPKLNLKMACHITGPRNPTGNRVALTHFTPLAVESSNLKRKPLVVDPISS